MKKKIAVLGAGLVGKTIAADLSTAFDVTSADINEEALDLLRRQGIDTRRVDVSDATSLRSFVAPFDLVIGAVPGFLGYRTARDQRIKSGIGIGIAIGIKIAGCS